MTPFHNMAKYRELLRTSSPPLIPFFPITKKDLTFLYDGNETQVGGLVNFEKLRMLSQQIRVIRSYCQRSILVSKAGFSFYSSAIWLGKVCNDVWNLLRVYERDHTLPCCKVFGSNNRRIFL